MRTQLKDLLEVVATGTTLSSAEAEAAMHDIMRGESPPEVVAGFLMGLRSRGETLDELVGFTSVMRQYATPVSLNDPDAIDLCGTGGDKSGTFNISTAAAFVVAGAGVTVAKHGNRSVSSRSGSSDVLSALDVRTNLGADAVEACLDEAGIAFIFAPLFHTALQHVMPVRRALGVRTFFNILGPLCNPAGVRRQLVGAFSLDMAELMCQILHRLGSDKVVCVHSDDGLDEFSLASESTFHSFDRLAGTEPTRTTVRPEDLGFRRASMADVRGGDADDNAAIIRSILSGNRGPSRDIVVLNASYALVASGRYSTPADGRAAAEESIDSGSAAAALERLIHVSGRFASD